MVRRLFILMIAIVAVACAPQRAVRAEPETAASDALNTTAAPTKEQLAQWIGDLNHNSYIDRERATQALIEAGSAAFDALVSTANGAQPEPADRAIWILRHHSRSQDNDLAIAALEHILRITGRPGLVDKAAVDLMRRRVAACEQHLAPLGAEVTIRLEPIDTQGNVANVVTAKIGGDWRGTSDDLRRLAELKEQAHFRLDGAPFNDAVLKFFAEKESLEFLHLFNTQVTPEAVDELKSRHPGATVYAKNKALLGVHAEKHERGVMVVAVQPRSGALNAGIMGGDIITAINGHKLPDFDRMTVRIAQHMPGDVIDVEILRNNEAQTLKVTLGNWDDQIR